MLSFVHGTGCGVAFLGEGFDILKLTQWGYASNPNLAGVLLVGLGCEVFQTGRMKELYDAAPAAMTLKRGAGARRGSTPVRGRRTSRSRRR